MIAVVVVAVGLVLAGLGVGGGWWLVRQMRAETHRTREHVTLTARALAAQLVHEREEHRRHIDAAAAVTVAQLTAQLVHEREELRRHVDAAAAAAVPVVTPRPVRPVPPVEVRAAPPLRLRSDEATPLHLRSDEATPLHLRSDEATPPAGSRWPGGAA